MSTNRHLIILSSINEMQGDTTVGTGCLQVLRGHASNSNVTNIENVDENERTVQQSDVFNQFNLIADKFETDGFVASEICGDISTLTGFVNEL